MLSPSSAIRVFLAVEPVDMRGSYNSLSGLARRLGLDPLDGHLYVFLNRRRFMAALLGKLCMENVRLRQALALAQQTVARLQESLDAALVELAALREESQAAQRELVAKVSALSEQVASGNDRIAELLAIAQRKKRKPPNQLPTPKAPPELEDDTRAAFHQRPAPRARVAPSRSTSCCCRWTASGTCFICRGSPWGPTPPT